VARFQNKKGINSVLKRLFSFAPYSWLDKLPSLKKRYADIIKNSGTATLAIPLEMRLIVKFKAKQAYVPAHAVLVVSDLTSPSWITMTPRMSGNRNMSSLKDVCLSSTVSSFQVPRPCDIVEASTKQIRIEAAPSQCSGAPIGLPDRACDETSNELQREQAVNGSEG
jgi:hypothetical protein